MSKLLINDIEVVYGYNTVLKNFNLELNNGELLVILGPSGCGKSTLLSCISGLVKPKYGEISFDNQVLYSKKNRVNIPVEKRNIGFVFQNYALWPHMNVYNNIAYSLKVRKIDKCIIKGKVLRLLEDIDLLSKEKCYPNELSGGEKQRVALARAVASEPRLLLLDEPLANIDAVLKNQILSLISKLNRDLKLPMIYVTHDQSEAFSIADRIVVMKDGEIIQDGCPKQIYRCPNNKFVANFVGCNNLINSCHLKRCNNFCKNSMLAIRPEDIIISKNGKFSGIVKRVVYKGSKTDLHVQFDNRLIVICVNSDDYKEGDIIRFNIDRYHVLNE